MVTIYLVIRWSTTERVNYPEISHPACHLAIFIGPQAISNHQSAWASGLSPEWLPQQCGWDINTLPNEVQQHRVALRSVKVLSDVIMAGNFVRIFKMILSTQYHNVFYHQVISSEICQAIEWCHHRLEIFSRIHWVILSRKYNHLYIISNIVYMQNDEMAIKLYQIPCSV